MDFWTKFLLGCFGIMALMQLYGIAEILGRIASRLDDTNTLLRGAYTITGANQYLRTISETLSEIKDGVEEAKWMERRADEIVDELRSIRDRLNPT